MGGRKSIPCERCGEGKAGLEPTDESGSHPIVPPALREALCRAPASGVSDNGIVDNTGASPGGQCEALGGSYGIPQRGDSAWWGPGVLPTQALV